jgi:putative ABC transport system permease protein
VLSGRVALFAVDYPDPAAMRAVYRRLHEALAAVPGVDAASLAGTLPASSGSRTRLEVDGRIDDGSLPPLVDVTAADADYFGLFALRLREGRWFDPRDHADAEPVAVIGRSLAERSWPGDSALGRRIRLGSGDDRAWLRVVGVVEDVLLDAGRSADPLPAVFRPLEQAPPRFLSLAVRSRLGLEQLADPVRQAVLGVDRELPVYWLMSHRDWLQAARFDTHLLGVLFGLFGAFALLLATAGIHAVLVMAVTQRTREIGLRRALGAGDRDLLRMLAGQTLRQVLIGLAVGMLAALAFARLLAGVLYGVEPWDPLALIGAIVVLAGTAVVASTLPARRALRVQPMQALRHD